MAGSSPSEFLTFYRAVRMSSSLRQCRASRISVARPFSTSLTRPSYGQPDEKSKDGKHVLDKQDKNNVQSYESQQGRDKKNKGEGGTATEAKDTKGAAAQAKKDFPEAPDTAIGMQDERGGKGH